MTPATASYKALLAASIAAAASSCAAASSAARCAAAARRPTSIGRTARATAEARSIGWLSASGAQRYSLCPACFTKRLPGAYLAVPVENGVAPEEGDHASQGQERPERDRGLPRLRPVAREEDCGGHEGGEEADEHRDDHRDPEPRPEESGELDVPHPQPARIHEGDEEQHEARAERAQDPLDARVVDRTQGEYGDGSREDDQIRDQPMLQVGASDDDREPAEQR